MAVYEREHPRGREYEHREGGEGEGGGMQGGMERGGAGVLPVLRRISWAAVFGGAVVGVITMAMLNILGIAIGATALDPGQGQNLQGLGIGAGLWWLLAFVIAMFAGGWVTGRLCDNADRSEGIIHGLVTWGVIGLMTFFMLTSAVGRIVGGAFGIVGQTVGALSGSSEVTGFVEQQVRREGVTEQDVDRAQAAATQVGQDVSDALAIAAFWGFFTLLLGGAAAAAGGTVGVNSERKAGYVTPRGVVEYAPGKFRTA